MNETFMANPNLKEKRFKAMKRKQKVHLVNRPYAKQLLVLFVCSVLILSNCIPSAAAEETTGNRTVKAGVFYMDGYHMQDGDGDYTGYGIELLNLISQYSHLNFEYIGYDKSWEEMQSMLKEGEIDVVTSARKTRQRAEMFHFPSLLNETARYCPYKRIIQKSVPESTARTTA